MEQLGYDESDIVFGLGKELDKITYDEANNLINDLMGELDG
jgi:hypothetical protein